MKMLKTEMKYKDLPENSKVFFFQWGGGLPHKKKTQRSSSINVLDKWKEN